MNITTPDGAILIEEPGREVGMALADVIRGHTTPSLTYISDDLIPGIPDVHGVRVDPESRR